MIDAMGKRRDGSGPGWVCYNEHMELKYDGGICVEMKVSVRDGLGCVEAAHCNSML